LIKNELRKRKIPEVLVLKSGQCVNNKDLWTKRRSEIIELLSSEIYGFSPPAPLKVKAAEKQTDEEAFAGKAVHSVIDLSFDTPKGEFTFPVNLVTPMDAAEVPLFLHIAFRPDIPDKYCPTEEIIDGGFAIASFCYNDVVPDRDDGFVEGLAGMFSTNKRAACEWGKISMWAWAASRVMDFLQTLDAVDRGRIAVVGHSRLGKTALWCAAQDERFAVGISNNSGCSGAALSRGKEGEQIHNITDMFGYWFCENYKKYRGNETALPFDQHFLLSAIAPRFVYVSSAEEDQWADPKSEFLCCVAASPVYELLGLKGLVTPDKYPETGTVLHEGNIGYHMRKGTHYLSRYDWQCFMEYMRKK
jgi:hypothetical protein